MKPHKRFYEIYLNDIARLLGDLRVEADHEKPAYHTWKRRYLKIRTEKK